MAQTLVITTPDIVDTSKRVFPQVGKCNIKIMRNGEYSKVDVWMWGDQMSIHPIKIVGGAFTGLVTANVTQGVVPDSVPVMDLAEITLSNSQWNYFEISVNNGFDAAYMLLDYWQSNTALIGGTEDTEALIDFSSLPYSICTLTATFSARKIRYDVTRWNISQVQRLSLTFAQNYAFNQDISGWDTRNVITMDNLLNGCKIFNRKIGIWNTSKVGKFSYLFNMCESFNQHLLNWNTSAATTMRSMFGGCKNFNQQVEHFNTALVTDISSMFAGAEKFNQSVHSFDVSKVFDFSSVFRDALSFTQDVSGWNVSSGQYFSWMFGGAKKFNSNIGHWDMAKAIDLSSMFRDALSFNHDIRGWNVGSVLKAGSMFRNAVSFNQDISRWNISKILFLDNMFRGATAFNQNLASWCSKMNVEATLDGFFEENEMSTINYDKFLNSFWLDIGTTRAAQWAKRGTPKIIHFGNSKYTQASAVARANLIALGWTLTDGGQAA